MFNKINIEKWERAEYFNHFMRVVPCVYNITANIDITKLLKHTKELEIKLYPTFIYMIGKVVNSNKEFRMAYDDGNLGYYDLCHPSYTIPNGIEGLFSGIWTGYEEKYTNFYEKCLLDISEYSKAKTYAPKVNQPRNTFYVSCAPDIAFTSLNMHIYNGAECLTPMFTIGKFFDDANKIQLPISACLHHAVCDGHHVGVFYKTLQQLADSFCEWNF